MEKPLEGLTEPSAAALGTWPGSPAGSEETARTALCPAPALSVRLFPVAHFPRAYEGKPAAFSIPGTGQRTWHQPVSGGGAVVCAGNQETLVPPLTLSH